MSHLETPRNFPEKGTREFKLLAARAASENGKTIAGSFAEYVSIGITAETALDKANDIDLALDDDMAGRGLKVDGVLVAEYTGFPPSDFKERTKTVKLNDANGEFEVEVLDISDICIMTSGAIEDFMRPEYTITSDQFRTWLKLGNRLMRQVDSMKAGLNNTDNSGYYESLIEDAEILLISMTNEGLTKMLGRLNDQDREDAMQSVNQFSELVSQKYE